MVKRATSAHLCQFRRLPSKVEDVLLLAEVLDDNLKTVWPGADDTPDSDTHRYTLFKQTPPPLSSPAKQTVVHAVHGAHAQVDQPFGFGRSLFALKVDELGVGSLQDEVEVLPPLAFTWGGGTEAGLIPAARPTPTTADVTFVEEEVAFLDNVFVESVFWFPPDSVIDFSPVDRVGENLFLILQRQTSGSVSSHVPLPRVEDDSGDAHLHGNRLLQVVALDDLLFFVMVDDVIHTAERDSESEGTVQLDGRFTVISLRTHAPVVVPPSHHVLIVGSGRDLEPLDVFIGAKEQGVVSGGVVRRPHQEAAHLADFTAKKTFLLIELEE